ncbi:MAG: hypothetical protein ABJ084_10930 [Halioglobus sp.]
MEEVESSQGKFSTGMVPFLLVSFLFLNFSYGSISLLLLGSLVTVIWPLTLVSMVAVGIVFYRYSAISVFGATQSTLWFLIVSVFSLLAAGSFYDISFDGQTYHQEAIIQLSGGWNPYQDKVVNLFTVPVEPLHAAINYYPKAPWIIASSYDLFFGDIETGKASFWLVCASAFSVTYTVSRDHLRLPGPASILLALITIANPIAISQSFSYYIDGHVYYLLVISFVCLYAGAKESTAWDTYVLFFMTTSLLVNMKVPAVAFSGFFILAFILYSLFALFRGGNRQIIKSTVLFSAGGILSLVLMGFHPYVSNTINTGNPFFAVLGDDRIIETSPQRPVDFEGLSQTEMFFQSIFSTSANPPWGSSKSSELKIPFTISWPAEVKAFQSSDLRTGGFGPIFSGVLVIALIFSVIVALQTGQLREWMATSGLSALLLLSSLMHPEAWWARYVPQFYLIPVIFLIFILRQLNRQQGQIMGSRMGGLLMVSILMGCLLVNAVLAASSYYPFVAQQTASIKRQMDTLKAAYQIEERTYEVFFGAFRSNHRRFERENLPFYELSQVESKYCGRVSGIPKSNAFVCDDRSVFLADGATLCGTAALMGNWTDLDEGQRKLMLERRSCVELEKGVTAILGLRFPTVSLVVLKTLDGMEVKLWTSNESIYPPPD